MSSQFDEVEDVQVTARRIVESQQERQKNRRKASRGPGTGTRSSVWSLIAASTLCVDSDSFFVCSVCSHEGNMNKNFSTSNIIAHYKLRHNQLRESIVRLNDSNATSDLLTREIEKARRQWEKKQFKKSFKRF